MKTYWKAWDSVNEEYRLTTTWGASTPNDYPFNWVQISVEEYDHILSFA